MKVYGFDDTDVARGELRAVEVDALDMHFEEEMAARFGWERLYRRFTEARAALIREMKAVDADSEMIDLVKSMKASFIPVDAA